MVAAAHDPDVPPGDRPGADGRADESAGGIAAAQQWLVDELRDECSDIGIGARGFDLDAFAAGVAVFAREAHRLGAPPERMLVLLKQCLLSEALPHADRERYHLYMDVAVRAAVRAYFAPGGAWDEASGTQGVERPPA